MQKRSCVPAGQMPCTPAVEKHGQDPKPAEEELLLPAEDDDDAPPLQSGMWQECMESQQAPPPVGQGT